MPVEAGSPVPKSRSQLTLLNLKALSERLENEMIGPLMRRASASPLEALIKALRALTTVNLNPRPAPPSGAGGVFGSPLTRPLALLLSLMEPTFLLRRSGERVAARSRISTENPESPPAKKREISAALSLPSFVSSILRKTG